MTEEETTRKRRPIRRLLFHQVVVFVNVRGPLHATTPCNPQGIAFMLKRMPPEARLQAREVLGEPQLTKEELEQKVEEAVEMTEGEQIAVWRRDEQGRPFVHDHFIMGHLRDCGKSQSRALNFWGLERFITETLAVRPERIYFDTEAKVLQETWPTHFDIYRMGRVSSFRTAEYVDSPVLAFRLYLANDPRWNRELLEDLLSWGSIHGLGGGRGRGMGRYRFSLQWGEMVEPEAVWAEDEG